MKKWILFFLISVIGAYASDSTWQKYKEDVLKDHHKIKGWCKREKAEKLMDFIHEIKPKICVEIGVYRGSSIYPIAKALKHEKKGLLYAVDPWSKEESLKFETDESNISCWGNMDYEKVYKKFCKMLKKNKIQSICKVLRITGEEALSKFKDESVDFIHVDGNHNEEACMKDVQLSLKKIKKGGYLLFDDANWHQTQKAVSYLRKHCKFVPKYSVSDECLLFQKH